MLRFSDKNNVNFIPFTCYVIARIFAKCRAVVGHFTIIAGTTLCENAEKFNQHFTTLKRIASMRQWLE